MRTDDFQPGTTLGRYEIVKKLAVGGMAQIYLARVRATAGFEKLVVLKRISPLVAGDRGFVQMFLDEARLAATLRHPNIADVFDVGTEDGSYYFAMEFIHGQDARSLRLAANELRRAIPLEVSLGILSGTAYALAYAHAKDGPNGPLGLVHRDISPSNILVSYDGAVKLVDFGIARAATRTTTTTLTGTLKGKVPYMSPEQCRGQVVDRRADIFSLGTVFYELTCGQRPFDGHSEYDTLEMIVNGTPRRPSELVPGYPPELEAITLRMLARDPGDRYQRGDDVLADLERVISERGLLVSERVVAKYMRELFAEEIAEWEDPVTVRTTDERAREDRDDPPLDENQPTLEVSADDPPDLRQLVTPEVRPPRLAPTRPAHWPRVPMPDRNRSSPSKRVLDFPDDSPTVRPEDTVPRTRPTRPPDFADESPTSRGTEVSSLADLTREPLLDTWLDNALQFDPILAHAEDILEEIDRDAPSYETADARAVRRITGLTHRVAGWLGAGAIDHAVAAADLVFEEDLDGILAQHALRAALPVLEGAFEAYLGLPDRLAVLTRPHAELARLDLEPPVRYLLSRIVGDRRTLGTLLAEPGMPRFETARWLCRLVLRKMIILA